MSKTRKTTSNLTNVLRSYKSKFSIKNIKKPNHPKKILIILLFIIVSFLITVPSLNLTTTARIEGGDFDYHIGRLQNSVSAILDGQIVPQLNPNSTGGFGGGGNIFYGPLPTYVAALLRLFTGNWVVIYNLTVIIGCLASGLVMLFVLKRVLPPDKQFAAIIGALIYILTPYHVNALLGLQSIGSFYAFIFVPLVFLGLYQIVKPNRELLITPLIVGVSGLLLTHTITTFIVALFSAIFLIINWRQIHWKQTGPRIAISALVILGVSAFFILPILEAKATNIYYIFSNTACVSFGMPDCHGIETYSLSDFLHSGVMLLSTVMIAATIALYFTLRKKITDKFERRLLLQGLVFSIVTIVLMTGLIPYEKIRILDSLQFSWRFLVIPAALCPVIISFLLSKIQVHHKIKIVILIAFVPLAALYARSYVLRSADITDFINSAPATSSESRENLPENFSLEAVGNIDLPRVLGGDSTLANFQKVGSHMSLDVDTEIPIRIEFPAIYYPGYRATINEQVLESAPSDNGLLSVSLPEHSAGTIKIRYAMSTATKIGFTITLTTVVCIVIYAILLKKSIITRRIKT
jgi:hypothetical protein